MFWNALLLGLGLLVASPAGAGLPDTPLPTFPDGKPAQLAFSLPLVMKNNGMESVVICTSLAPAPIDVGLEVFDAAGVLANSIAAGNGALLDVGPGQTVTIGTGSTAVMHEDAQLTLDPPVTVLANGSGRIVATATQLVCTAFVVDSRHAIVDPAACPGCKPPPIANLAAVSPCTPGTCDDANPCTVDDCSEGGGCVHTAVADDTACDDGDACSMDDACLAGRCSGTAVVCGADTPCRQGAVCQPATGTCVDTDPFSVCAPGGGGTKTDCAAEWVVDNPGNRKGIRSNAQVCRQGDAACDFDADPGTCTFRLRACLNNQDVALPACTPSSALTYDLRRPSRTSKRPTDREAALTILDAVGALGPSTVDGRRQNRLTFDPPVAGADECTPALAVTVPVGKAMTVRTAVASPTKTKDRDRLKLACSRR